ncbi:DOMON domain-containing protein [Pontiella sulfatireligans]|uniref:Glycoside hydrolase family 42 N-terminal domain-containing protein n=1 Tax=Pontiella sulfatireligans TaxID=2750658 RepID=A0A6C2UP24_9BACT|nr:hypothetical protein [Pontiella sulfatireligans]VGO21938.1 hypothetical protein SCARR_04018 [Pontiella sulfatireligans]
MMKYSGIVYGLFVTAVLGADASRMIDVRHYKEAAPMWTPRQTESLADVEGFTPSQTGPELSRFGGRKDRQVEATGFFRTEKIDGRWWLVDPEGFLWFGTGVSQFEIRSSELIAQAEKRYGSVENALVQLDEWLWSIGVNTASDRSPAGSRRNILKRPMPYFTNLAIMARFGKEIGSAHVGYGHMNFEAAVMPIFDPRLKGWMKAYLASTVKNCLDDPWMIGYTTDNELPFPPDVLDRSILKLPKDNPQHQTALKWLKQRNHPSAPKKWTKKIRSEYAVWFASMYYKITSEAVREADPRHLLLGSRVNHWEKQWIFEGSRDYVDLYTINHYSTWTPRLSVMEWWKHFGADKPFFITEWYAKGIDSGLDNSGGAGWLVKTQKERGFFYQNFTLALMHHPNCVGFHWFRLIDDGQSEQSVNKGFLDGELNLWEPLVCKVKELNLNAYRLIDHFRKNPMDQRYLLAEGSEFLERTFVEELEITVLKKTNSLIALPRENEDQAIGPIYVRVGTGSAVMQLSGYTGERRTLPVIDGGTFLYPYRGTECWKLTGPDRCFESPASLITLPKKCILIPGRDNTLSTRISNPTERPLNITLSWRCQKEEAVSSRLLSSGQIADVQVCLPVPADLGEGCLEFKWQIGDELKQDWSPVSHEIATLIHQEETVVSEPQFSLPIPEQLALLQNQQNPGADESSLWKGPEDTSAEICISVEEKDFVIRALVHDDIHRQAAAHRTSEHGDCVQFTLEHPSWKSKWKVRAHLDEAGKSVLRVGFKPQHLNSISEESVRCLISPAKNGLLYEFRLARQACQLTDELLKSGIFATFEVFDNDTGQHRERTLSIGSRDNTVEAGVPLAL